MCVLRRLDAVPEPTKQTVLDNKQLLEPTGITAQFVPVLPASILLTCSKLTPSG